MRQNPGGPRAASTLSEAPTCRERRATRAFCQQAREALILCKLRLSPRSVVLVLEAVSGQEHGCPTRTESFGGRFVTCGRSGLPRQNRETVICAGALAMVGANACCPLR
jgi:hypothetical protein